MIGQLNARTTGWVRYFALTHYGDTFRQIDRWLRRRLRCARLKQCKRVFGMTRFLRSRGLSHEAAWTLALSGKGWWRLANTPQASQAMPTRWLDALGLLSLQGQHAALTSLRKPPDTLSTRPVVWEGDRHNAGPLPDSVSIAACNSWAIFPSTARYAID
jgi:hypothetical protein